MSTIYYFQIDILSWNGKLDFSLYNSSYILILDDSLGDLLDVTHAIFLIYSKISFGWINLALYLSKVASILSSYGGIGGD